MKPIEQLTFTDDYMFGEVMKNEKNLQRRNRASFAHQSCAR